MVRFAPGRCSNRGETVTSDMASRELDEAALATVTGGRQSLHGGAGPPGRRC